MEFNSQEYFSQLEMLVNIDSGFGCSDGISHIADFFEQRFQEIGFHVQRHAGPDNTASCIIASNTTQEHYDVLFVGHMDTAFEKGEVTRSPYRTDSVNAYGPGIADMKAGTLAIYHILKCAPKELLDALSVCVIINGDEETFACFSEPLLIEYASRSDRVFVLESAFPDGSHCLQRKGRLRYELEFNGIPVHSGYIFETRNASAILEMSHWIQVLNSLVSREKGISFNVGLVSGGTAVSMVPAKATMAFEFRMWDVAEQTRLENTIAHMIRHPFIDGVTVKVLDSLSKPPMHPSRSTLKYVAQVTQFMEHMGYDFMVRPRGGMSDANHMFQYTPVCIDGLGPRGELNTGHDGYESIIMDSVPECIEINLALLQDIARRKGKKNSASFAG